MRDRIRSRGIPVMGPLDHGMCQSIYFAGLEGLALECTYGGAIDGEAWIDPEVQKLAGISDEELVKFKSPAVYVKPAKPVAQPGPDASGPHMVYPKEVYATILSTPDEMMLHSVVSEPPVKPRSKL